IFVQTRHAETERLVPSKTYTENRAYRHLRLITKSSWCICAPAFVFRHLYGDLSLAWSPAQRIHQPCPLHPELVLRSALLPVRIRLLKPILTGQSGEYNFTASDSEDDGGHVISSDLVWRHVRVCLNMLHALQSHTERADAVHR